MHTIAAGNALLAPSVTRRVIADYAKQPPRPENTAVLDRLTGRESEVLRLIATA